MIWSVFTLGFSDRTTSLVTFEMFGVLLFRIISSEAVAMTTGVRRLVCKRQ